MANKKRRSRRPEGSQQPGQPQSRLRPAPQPRPAQRRQTRKGPGGPSRTGLIAAAGGGAVLVVVILIAINLAGGSSSTPSVGATSMKGSADARVVVEEFSDFQCPFCARFALETFPRIDKEYVETGKVRWTFKHFARIGEESKQAAMAAECAGEQQQFWPYHDKLFAAQQGENRGAFSSDKLKAIAKNMGLTEAFNSCLDSGKYSSLVEQHRVEANQKRVNGTPTFFINGVMLEGAQPFSEFQKVIEAALAKQ